MIKFQEMQIGPVYYVKHGPVIKRLRVKTRGISDQRLRTAYCGSTIHGTYYSLTYLDMQGNIEILCQVTGEKTKLNVGVKK